MASAEGMAKEGEKALRPRATQNLIALKLVVPLRESGCRCRLLTEHSVIGTCRR